MDWEDKFDEDLGNGFLTDEFFPDGQAVKEWIRENIINKPYKH